MHNEFKIATRKNLEGQNSNQVGDLDLLDSFFWIEWKTRSKVPKIVFFIVFLHEKEIQKYIFSILFIYKFKIHKQSQNQ